jgi:tetratricopeptide (TPR) repeat protein
MNPFLSTASKEKIFLFLVLMVSVVYSSYGQSNKPLDSLINVLKNSAEDTNKVNTLILLSWHAFEMSQNDAEVKKYADEALALAQKINYKKGIAAAYNRKGPTLGRQGNYSEGLKLQFAALKIWEEIGNKKGVSETYTIMGGNYAGQKKISEAIKYYSAAIKIKEELGDRAGIAEIYNNIGGMYMSQSNFLKA